MKTTEMIPRWKQGFEKLASNISVMKGNDFYREIEDKELRSQFKYLSQGYHHVSTEVDIVYRVDGEIAGAAGIWPNPYDKDVLWMPFISVRQEFKNKGIGTALAKAVADYAKKEGKILSVSSFSDEGHLYLKKVFERLKDTNGYRILTKNE